MATYKYHSNEFPVNSLKPQNKVQTVQVPKNGVWRRRYDDLIWNIDTGDMYLQTSGPGSWVSFIYQGFYATGRPAAPTDVTMKRNGTDRFRFTTSWKIPKSNVGTGTRITSQKISWYAGAVGSKSGDFITEATLSTGATSNLSPWLNLDAYYPKNQSGKKIQYISVDVDEANKSGKSGARATYKIYPPRNPSLSNPTQNASTGVVSCVVKTNAGTDQYDKFNTAIRVQVWDSRLGKNIYDNTVNTAANEYTASYDFQDRQGLGYGDYVRVTFSAYSRGIGGDSGTVSKEYYYSYPYAPSIKSYTSATRSVDAKISFSINAKADTTHPITGVKAQKLVSTSYEKASDIPGNASWQDFGPTDNGNVQSIAASIADVLPTAGTITWVRLIAWYESRDVFFRYSNPIRLKELETPAPVASAGPAKIYEVSKVGQKVRVRTCWDADDANFTQVAWSTDRDSWRSSKQPEMFAMRDDVWDEGSVTVSGTTYAHHLTMFIDGLEMTETYFIRARRLIQNSGDDPTNYSAWSEFASTLGQGTPFGCSFVLNRPRYVVADSPIRVSWDIDDEIGQDNVIVYALPSNAQSGTPYKVIGSVEGSATSVEVPWDRVYDALNGVVSPQVKLNVGATLMSGTYNVQSGFEAIPVVSHPEISLGVPEEITAQPLRVGLASNDSSVAVTIIVTAKAMSSMRPDGDVQQVDGDVIWSGVVKPEWTSVSSYEPIAVADAQSDYDDAVSAYETAMESVTAAWEDVTDANDDMASAWNAYVAMSDDDPDKQTAYQTYQTALAAYEAAYEDYLEVEADDEEADMREAEAALSEALAMDELALTGMSYVSSVELPSGLEFLDGNDYVVTAHAELTDYGLVSETQQSTMTVDWSHKAPEVQQFIWEVDAHDEEDEDGNRVTYSDIPMPVPPTAYSDDVCDLYRVTKDGSVLIYSGAAQGETLRDMYSPFGMSESYVVATRTADGSVDWFRFPYVLRTFDVLDEQLIRIDWPKGYVEVERGVALSDRYAKDFESRKHLDGSISGYWNKGTSRTSGFTGCVIRGYDEGLNRKLRELARYDGPCFVRTSSSHAFEADVQIDGIDESNKTARVGVSLSITEVGLTDEYMAEIVTNEEDEEEEEQND